MLNQPEGCGLSAEELAAQRERYAVLRRSVRSARIEPLLVEVELGADVDEELVREMLEIERTCCPFFAIEHEAPYIRFRTDEGNEGALATLAAGLSTPA